MVVCQRRDGLVDVAWVTAKQATVQQKDFSGCVCGRVEECGAAHVQGVLQTGLSLGLLFPYGLQAGNMVGGVAACVRDTLSEAVAHADYAQLGYGVLLEEFKYEGLGVAEGKEVAGRPHVGFEHGG